MAGALIGALIVPAGFAALDTRESSQVQPMSAPAEEPATTAATASNPDLAPQHLQIAIEGDIATARWDRAIDEPEVWGLGVTPNEAEQPVIDRTNLPGQRTASTRIDPSWDRICFTVVGLRAGQFGGARECVSR